MLLREITHETDKENPNQDFVENIADTLKRASAFFDGYADYLEELMKKDGLTDSDFYTALEDYDTEDNLYCWWLMCEGA